MREKKSVEGRDREREKREKEGKRWGESSEESGRRERMSERGSDPHAYCAQCVDVEVS